MGIGALTKLCSLATAIKVSQLSQIGVQVSRFSTYMEIYWKIKGTIWDPHQSRDVVLTVHFGWVFTTRNGSDVGH